MNANAGLQRMTREHIGIAIALRIPIVIVITKIDICPPNIYDQNMAQIMKILKSNAVKKLPIVIKQGNDAQQAANNMLSERIVLDCATIGKKGREI